MSDSRKQRLRFWMWSYVIACAEDDVASVKLAREKLRMYPNGERNDEYARCVKLIALIKELAEMPTPKPGEQPSSAAVRVASDISAAGYVESELRDAHRAVMAMYVAPKQAEPATNGSEAQ